MNNKVDVRLREFCVTFTSLPNTFTFLVTAGVDIDGMAVILNAFVFVKALLKCHQTNVTHLSVDLFQTLAL